MKEKKIFAVCLFMLAITIILTLNFYVTADNPTTLEPYTSHEPTTQSGTGWGDPRWYVYYCPNDEPGVQYDPYHIGVMTGAWGDPSNPYERNGNNLVTVSDQSYIVREGYKFMGWNSDQNKANEGIVQYLPGDTFYVDDAAYYVPGGTMNDAIGPGMRIQLHVLLYAVWELEEEPTTLPPEEPSVEPPTYETEAPTDSLEVDTTTEPTEPTTVNDDTDENQEGIIDDTTTGEEPPKNNAKTGDGFFAILGLLVLAGAGIVIARKKIFG